MPRRVHWTYACTQGLSSDTRLQRSCQAQHAGLRPVAGMVADVCVACKWTCTLPTHVIEHQRIVAPQPSQQERGASLLIRCGLRQECGLSIWSCGNESCKAVWCMPYMPHGHARVSPGKCFKLHVGVKAPGTAKRTTFLFLHSESTETSLRFPSPSKYLSFWSLGTLHAGPQHFHLNGRTATQKSLER